MVRRWFKQRTSGWQASADEWFGSHCYSSRSGSSRDDEVPRAWLVVVAIPLLVSLL